MSDAQSADDLTQETYVRALGSLGRFRAESSARTWLLSIARRVVADHIRALQARPRPATLAGRQTDAQRSEPAEHLVAEVCGCPVGTIRSRVARARDDLAAAMRDGTVRHSATG